MSEDKKIESPGFTSLRISNRLYAEIGKLAESLPGMSANAFGVQCIEAILSMVNTPKEQRITPAIVTMLDVVRGPQPMLAPRPDVAETKPELRSTRLLRKAKETIK